MIPRVSLRLALILPLFASATAFSQTTIFELEGPLPAPFPIQFGRAVSAAGDVNADGYGDFLIGIPYDDAFGPAAGSVRVISGKQGNLLRSFQGMSLDQLGRSLCALGDVNRDGYDDFAIGLYGAGGSEEGTVRVYSGLSGAVLHEITEAGNDFAFGYRIAAAGDLNGDGVCDLLVPGYRITEPTGRRRTGDVWLYDGATGARIHRIPGHVSDSFWLPPVLTAANPAGDLDGDGTADVIVVSGGTDNLTDVRVFSGASWTILFAFSGTADAEYFYDGGPAGDWNGDGQDDFTVLGQTGPLGSGTVEVRVHSGADGSVLHVLSPPDPREHFLQLANIGDADGDGLEDLAVLSIVPSTPHWNSWSVRAYAGGSGASLFGLDRELSGATEEHFSVAGAGDVNGDGLSDLIVGATPYRGRVVVRSAVDLETGAVSCTGQACPCNNDVAVGEGTGCANSTGAGARLLAYGCHLHLNDNLELELSQAPPSTAAIFLRSRYWGSNNPLPTDGLPCLYAPERVQVVTTGGGGAARISFTSDWMFGVQENFQCWYRDSPSTGPCGTGNNYSNVVMVSPQ